MKNLAVILCLWILLTLSACSDTVLHVETETTKVTDIINVSTESNEIAVVSENVEYFTTEPIQSDLDLFAESLENELNNSFDGLSFLVTHSDEFFSTNIYYPNLDQLYENLELLDEDGKSDIIRAVETFVSGDVFEGTKDRLSASGFDNLLIFIALHGREKIYATSLNGEIITNEFENKIAETGTTYLDNLVELINNEMNDDDYLVTMSAHYSEEIFHVDVSSSLIDKIYFQLSSENDKVTKAENMSSWQDLLSGQLTGEGPEYIRRHLDDAGYENMLVVFRIVSTSGNLIYAASMNGEIFFDIFADG